MIALSSAGDSPVVELVDDTVRTSFIDRFRTELGDGLVDTYLRPADDLWMRVSTESWVDAGRIARDALGMDYFCFLSAIDWLPSPFGRGEDDPTEPAPERSTEIKQGYTGGSTRLQVFARVYSTRRHIGFTLKVDVPDDTATIATWVSNYAGANWHEREAWEMFGITFAGHPDLRHLYLPGAFEGFPLRKDFPLLARMVKPWPGIVDVEPFPAGFGDEEAATE